MVAVDGGEHSQTGTGSPACPGRQIGVTVTAANTVEQIIGERLRLRRTAFGLTQEQLGQTVGLSYQQIQKYENGSNQITVTRLLQLADRLAVPVAYFLAGLPGAEAATGPRRQTPNSHRCWAGFAIARSAARWRPGADRGRPPRLSQAQPISSIAFSSGRHSSRTGRTRWPSTSNTLNPWTASSP